MLMQYLKRKQAFMGQIDRPVQKPPFSNQQQKKGLLDFSFVAQELTYIFLNTAKVKLFRNVQHA